MNTIYALVLIIYSIPQTIVTIGVYGTLNACMARAAKIEFSNDIGKAACVRAGEGWK